MGIIVRGWSSLLVIENFRGGERIEMNGLEKDLCGAVIGGIIAGPKGAIAGAILCHALFGEENNC